MNFEKRNIFVIFIIVFAITLGVVLGVMQVRKNVSREPGDNENDQIIDLPVDDVNKKDVEENENKGNEKKSKDEEDPANKNTKKSVKAKAVYLTGWSAGTKSKRESTITNLKENGFNAVVVDIKDEAGRLSYSSKVQTAIDIKASQGMIANIENVIKEFHDNDIYVIGRIVTFKDPLYAKNNTANAYHYADGSVWKDYSGNNWPNPYNKDSWEYPIALAKEAATLGFDEIQFDYVRFPSSEGKIKQISFGFDSDTKTKADTINSFLERVMSELKEYNVVVSVDVFGITTKKKGDFENIGQDFAKIAQIVDVICPMVYPSHYAYNEYKIARPDTNPYGIIYGALKDAKTRISELGEVENIAIIRPYLQDFTASWLGKGNYITYGTKQVKDQIQACFDLRIDEFTLWDPSNKYCYDALGQANWTSEEEYQAKLLEEQKKEEEEKKKLEEQKEVVE